VHFNAVKAAVPQTQTTPAQQKLQSTVTVPQHFHTAEKVNQPQVNEMPAKSDEKTVQSSSVSPPAYLPDRSQTGAKTSLPSPALTNGTQTMGHAGGFFLAIAVMGAMLMLMFSRRRQVRSKVTIARGEQGAAELQKPQPAAAGAESKKTKDKSSFEVRI
jgi:hypothetical protein